MKRRILKIAILTIALILVKSTSYARYMKSEIVKGRQEIIKPIFNVKEGIPIKIDNENKINCYEFVINNFNEDEVSEIGFLYTIEIISNIDLESNFNLKLYNEDGEIKLSDLKTSKISIKGNEKTEQKYRICIECNEIEDEEDYTERELETISGTIQIRVSSEQEKI